MRRTRQALGIVAALALTGCVSTQQRMKSNALEYLYPRGAAAAPASDVTLKVPVRVGIAFAPATAGWQDTFTEDQKRVLLQRIADAFRERPSIASVQTIPSTYLQNGGGFEDLDRVAAAFGIDLVALVSYDQVQFTDSGKASIAYLTVVGAYFVEGEKNETRTLLDAAVFDIPSRAMLFNASGRSGSKSRSTPTEVGRELRDRSTQGFSEATDDLITNLGTALDAFRDQARSGTVRGPGTPAVTIESEPVGESGGGALGLGDAVAVLLLAGAALLGARAR
jgi:rhombotail lipoprotein